MKSNIFKKTLLFKQRVLTVYHVGNRMAKECLTDHQLELKILFRHEKVEELKVLREWMTPQFKIMKLVFEHFIENIKIPFVQNLKNQNHL